MKKFIKFTFAATAALAILGAADRACAADVSWSTAVVTTGSADVYNAGTSVLATYFSPTAGTDTVNGIVFTASGTPATTTQNGVTLTQTNWDQNYGTGFMASTTLGDASYTTLLESAAWTHSWGNPIVLSLTGLTYGASYLVQFFVADYRVGGLQSETVGSTGTDINVPTLYFAGATGGNYVIGTFTADSSTEGFAFTGPGGGTQVNAFQLQTVPEPSTWAMLLGGLGMLTMFRRRRA